MHSLYKKRNIARGGTGHLPKMLFLFMALLGSVLVWILKSHGADPMLPVFVTVGLIVIYCGLAWKTDFFYIREDQIGDNAYYLGFLFTLSSLAYALWKFQIDKGSDPADIIGSFGVALWSTIVGVAARVTFAQMRQDPDDIEKAARVKMAQAASLLSSDLYQASLTFNTYARSLQQSVEEVFLHAKNISSNTGKVFEDLNKKILKIESPDSLINNKIDGLFENLEGATDKLNTLADAQGKSVAVLTGSCMELSGGIKALNAQVLSLKDNSSVVEAGTQHIQKVVSIVSDLQAALAKLSESFTSLDTKQAQVIENLTEHADELESQLARSRQYTEDAHASLASITQSLAAKLQ